MQDSTGVKLMEKKKEEVAVVYLHVADFKLVSGSRHFYFYLNFYSDVTLPCSLSPKMSAVAMEIRWFKGADCICVYQNGQVKEGNDYEGRVSLFIHELEEGNVSLMLRNAQESDKGSYMCKITHGKDKVESDKIFVRVKELKLTTGLYTYDVCVIKPYTICVCAGDEVTLPCQLSPRASASAMEIRWFKETDCICVYQNGQVNEAKGYEGRVSLFTHKLEEGNVSLMLRNVQDSDNGEYKCEVNHRGRKMDNNGVYLHVSEFKLVHKPEDVGKTSVSEYGFHIYKSDGDATLPCYLSPKMSAVAMEIRWFKGTECICVYQNGEVKEEKGYEGRVSLFTHELEEGNVSLMLKNVQETGYLEMYRCEVTCGDQKVETLIYLHKRSSTLSGFRQKSLESSRSLRRRNQAFRLSRRRNQTLTALSSSSGEESSDDENTPETRTRKLSDPCDLRPRKPGRRWSNPIELPNMRSSVGDMVTLQCELSPEIREIWWFKGTECVHQEAFEQYQFCLWGTLTLKDVQIKDAGQYRCEAHGERKKEIAVIYLHVAEFKLVSSSQPSGFFHYFPGDDVTLSCHLSPKQSAVPMEIRWFKEADCICVYQNGHVREEIDYEGRLSLSTHDLKEGNVSLMLRNVRESDNGRYKCKITRGKDKVENDQISLCVKELKLTPEPDHYRIRSVSEASVDQPHTVHAYTGDEVTLPCHLSPLISAVDMEIRWFKGTDCICVYQNDQVNEGKGYEDRVSLFNHNLEEGNVSLMLRNVQESDDGEYKCEVTCQKYKMENSGVYLNVSEFKLDSSFNEFFSPDYFSGDDATLSCHLSPKMSAVAMEIRWFKGRDCICVYQNRQVREERGYEGRVSLFTHTLEEGIVSLMLRNVQKSDDGKYTCKVTHRKDKVEKKSFWLHVSELELTPKPFSYVPPRMKPYTICACAGVQVTLPCHLSSIMSAVTMEIRWFKGTDCICVYQDGQVKEGKVYEGRVSLFTDELEKGNVSLMLRNVQKTDNGEYKCEVTRRENKMENSGVYLHVSEFQLVHKPEDVGKSTGSEYGFDMKMPDGDDATLPCYLSPKQSAVAMEIRWFKGTDCMCVYQNGQVREEKGYEGRVSLFIHELEEGNVSLMLRKLKKSDFAVYRCEVTRGDEKVETSVYFYKVTCKTLSGLIPQFKGNSSNDENTPETRTRKYSDPCDLRPRNPGRRRSNQLDLPTM